MTFETDLRERLKDNAGVTAVVGAKDGIKSIDWNERRQGAPYPAIVLDVVFGDRSQHFGGFNAFQSARTQFRCTATNRKAAIDLREAVIAAITPGAVEGNTEFLRAQEISHFGRTEKSEAATLHHEFVDAAIWHGSAPAT